MSKRPAVLWISFGVCVFAILAGAIIWRFVNKTAPADLLGQAAAAEASQQKRWKESKLANLKGHRQEIISDVTSSLSLSSFLKKYPRAVQSDVEPASRQAGMREYSVASGPVKEYYAFVDEKLAAHRWVYFAEAFDKALRRGFSIAFPDPGELDRMGITVSDALDPETLARERAKKWIEDYGPPSHDDLDEADRRQKVLIRYEWDFEEAGITVVFRVEQSADVGWLYIQEIGNNKQFAVLNERMTK
jgi:hypothetical protein